MSAFATHLREAIALNRARRPVYAAATSGRSEPLSALLLRSERAALPVAWWIDARARRFQRAGVPVVAEDFVSMSAVRPAHAPPLRRGRMARRELDALDRRVRAYGAAVREAARCGELFRARRLSADLIDAVDGLEIGHDAHLAMTRHLVESIGLAATNGERWRRETGGRADALVRDLVIAQTLALRLAVPIDAAAQRLHGEGVGIVVNDVPAIPFPRG